MKAKSLAVYKSLLVGSLSALLVAGLALPSIAQSRYTVQDYISMYKEYAVKDMVHSGVPASITLAQGILESDCGNSILARNTNNHFGIKCKKEWTGEGYLHDDDEKQECFRKYPSVLDSYDDHSEFLLNRERYSALFKLDITDYKGWAYGLKAAGYATNPKYPQLLIKIIEENELHYYDAKRGAKDIEEDQGTYASVPADEKVYRPKSKVINESKKPVKTSKTVVKAKSKPVQIANAGKRGEINGVSYVIAGLEESFLSIATANNLTYADVLMYNDVAMGSIPQPGSPVYIEKKKRRSKTKHYVAKTGDTMYQISQKYAIRLKKLYKLNGMTYGKEPFSGEVISLR